MHVSFSDISSRSALSVGHAKIRGTPTPASGSSELEEPTILQNSQDNTVCSGKPSDFGSPREELDLTEDIKEGFLEEVIAELRRGCTGGRE